MEIKLADGGYITDKEILALCETARKNAEANALMTKPAPRKLTPEEQAFQERISDNIFAWQDEDDED